MGWLSIVFLATSVIGGIVSIITQKKKLTWKTAAQVLIQAIHDTGSEPAAVQTRSRTQPAGQKTDAGEAISGLVKELGANLLKK